MCNCTSWMRHRTRVYPSSAISLSKSATADLDAQARNPYSRSWLWIPGSRFARPGMTGYGDVCSSIHPRLRRDVLHVVGHGVVVHRAIIDGGGAALVDPGQRVLHPVLVVALGKILPGVCPAALG